MIQSPLMKVLLALAVLAVASIVWRLARTKRKVAGARGANSSSRAKDLPTRYRAGNVGSANKIKALAIWGTAALLIGWIALSLFHPEAAAPPAEAVLENVQAAAAAPPAPATAPTIAMRLGPPPAPGFEPTEAVQDPSPPWPADVSFSPETAESAPSVQSENESVD
ncbi:MAG: hypothetical protein LBJ64_10160, partial [Deltaproteobacteria bacterium]|nr:hypothetical protein [Deltaproteobacteria bacterium]